VCVCVSIRWLCFTAIASLVVRFCKLVRLMHLVFMLITDCLVHFARLANTLLKDEESARDITFLLVTLSNFTD